MGENATRTIACVAVAVVLFSIAACAGQGSVPTPAAKPTARPTVTPSPTPAVFDGEQALVFVRDQIDFGPRPTGSEASRQTGDYIMSKLDEYGWQTTEQAFEYLGTQARNIIGTRGQGETILLGAHYDTRRRADRDPSDPDQPVPGASDGASGVAVLLELARVLNVEATGHRIQLAFFDAEDNGELDGWGWIVGSQYLASHLTENPSMMILVDMVGDADQQLYWEANSNTDLRERIWRVAADLGYEAYFIPQVRHSLIDDHQPFLARGIPAVDIIDFDYPYWHTAQDTLDKVSAESLERVGRTLQAWLERGAP